MNSNNFYVLFSDLKTPLKVSFDVFSQIRWVARGLNAVLTESSDRFGNTLTVAFSRNFYLEYLPTIS